MPGTRKLGRATDSRNAMLRAIDAADEQKAFKR